MKTIINAFAIVFFLTPVFALAYSVTDGIGTCSVTPDSGLHTAILNFANVMDPTAANYNCIAFIPDGSFLSGLSDGNQDGGYPADNFAGTAVNGGLGMYHIILSDNTSLPLCTTNYNDCKVDAATKAYGDFFLMREPSLQDLIDEANTQFDRQTNDPTPAQVTSWMADNFLKIWIGYGFALLFTLRYWLVALVIFSAIVYFAFRAFQFNRT